MGTDNKKSNKTMSAEQLMLSLFDDGVYTEVSPSLYSDGVEAEAVAAFGKVCGQLVYAFAQSDDRCSGAMSVAQANKLKKLYALALKTGSPIVGFYKDATSRLSEGNMLLDSLGELLCASSQLSGVVPQISVVLGKCVSTMALLAANADFVVKTEDAVLSISESCCTGKKSTAVSVKSDSAAVDAVVNLLSYLPSNNLSPLPFADEVSADACTDFDTAFDMNSKLQLFEGVFDDAEIAFQRIMGNSVGTVKTLGKKLSSKTAKKIASFVRFCDAFSIPVITAVDTEGFQCLGGAKVLLSAYAEATTAKISVITGQAVGMGYLSLAGKGARADYILALSGAVVSPVSPEGAAYIALGDKLTTVALDEQEALIKDYIKAELSAENSAKQGYIDGVIPASELRNKLANYLDVLSGKREDTLPKKHTTV
ncbi:MAG: carboxyl transferase domain-containing protein [Ruminococcus sp.]